MRFFTHAKDCPTPNAQLDQASEGRLKCPACKYVSPGPTQTEHPAAIVTRYVCRAHPDLPVRANGKGCPACDRDRQAAQRTRQTKRAKATAPWSA